MTLPEAGKIIDSMRGTPALLAVIVLQLATLGFLFYISSANAERQQAREMKLLEECVGQ